AAGGAAAAVRVRRQVFPARRPGAVRRRGRRTGMGWRRRRALDLRRPLDAVRTGSADRHDPRRRPRVLEPDRARGATRRRGRDGADRRPAPVVRGAHPAGRPGHGLHGDHGARPARAGGLRRGRPRGAARAARAGGRTMTRWLPFPVMAAFLLVMWLLLQEALAPGHVILGAILGMGGAWALTRLEPPPVRLRRPRAMLKLAGLVLKDIVRSNIA